MPVKIVDLYNTIQGEGLHIGQQAMFLRLANCNLDCSFCDTDFKSNIETVSEHDMAKRIFSLHKEYSDSRTLNLVITGGEPLLQDLDPLFATLGKMALASRTAMFKINYFVETNGLLYKPWIHKACVTISPKTPVKKLNPETLRHARVLKFLFGNKFPRFYEDLPHHVKAGKYLFLQPIEDGRNTKSNTLGALAYCMAHPEFRLSIQIHKILGVK